MTVWKVDEHRTAPFTDDEIVSLNCYQVSGTGHPFTCGNDVCRGPDKLACRAVLRAGPDGWFCEHCDYTQAWAWKWMTDWSWEGHGIWALHVLAGTREGVIGDEPQA